MASPKPAKVPSEIPSTMRASQWSSSSGGFEKHMKVNTNAPMPKGYNKLPKDHTLVKVAYATPNPVDYKLADVLPFVFTKPAITGLDYSGVVVKTTLPHIKTGELVFGALALPSFGTMAEYLVVSKSGCVPVPNDVSLRDAACVGIVGLTAYQTIAPFVKSGDKVFINGGSGGVGTFSIQIAKALGCVVTTTCSGANVELCKSLGADNVIDYRSEDPVKTLRSSGHQYDLIVDNVFTTPALYWSAHQYLKPSGRFVTIAGSPTFSSVLDMLKVFLWPSFLGGGQRKFQFVGAELKAADYEIIAKLMQEGKVKAVIEKEFDLEQAGEAYMHLKSGRTKGKLVVKVAGEDSA